MRRKRSSKLMVRRSLDSILAMSFSTVRFDRVFDLHRRVGGRYPPHTEFSFESNGRVHYSVRVPGHPTIEVGMTVTAVLTEPGNWQSLKGWRNLSNGEFALPATRQSITSACCSLFIALLFAPTKRDDHFGIAAAFSAFLFLIAIGLFVQWWHQRSVARALRTVSVNPPASTG